jgi:recombination protein RecT
MSNIRTLVKQESVNKRFHELLGKKAPGFITSLLQVVQGNEQLKKAEPQTVLNAAATAAALDLPINQNLGFAWIIPYNNRKKTPEGWKTVTEAQFQLGYKGYVQLALRTGQYSRINVVSIYGNQYESWDPLTEEFTGDLTKEPEGKPVGYLAYFRLLNGFEKKVYWKAEKALAHAQKYSKGYKSGKSPWNDGQEGFDGMAKKSALKEAISKWGIMSIELEKAILADQAVQYEEGKYSYIDNPPTMDLDQNDFDKEKARILEHIQTAETPEQLHAVREVVANYDLETEYEDRVQWFVDQAGADEQE